MPDPPRSTPSRRRLSLAYDPARDTFKEIPDTRIDEAIAEDVDEESKPDIAVTSSPTNDKTATDPARKRKRSASPGKEAKDDSHYVENGHEESPTVKKQRNTVSPETRVKEGPPKRDGGREESPGSKKSRTPASPPRPEHRSPKLPPNGGPHEKPPARTPADLPRIPRKPREEGEVSASASLSSAFSRRPEQSDRRRNENFRRRSQSPRRRSPSSLYRRRSPPRERRRSPSPIRDSPPRELIRPGGARGRGRNVLAEQQRLAAEREQKNAGFNVSQNRGVQDVSNQFYNARPEWVKERGREWRKNESRIKGLRSYNNWVKSCLIHKFSAEEKREVEDLGWGEVAKEPEEQKPLLVLDVGCGKGGDLGKWQLAPQVVGLYVGLDPAETSIQQARERYQQMRRGRRPIFDARFVPQDCFGAWIGDVGIVREVGIDPNAGSGQPSRWGGGGFDIVASMFTMHYAFESEEKVKMMLRNVAGSLKKGGRFIGVVPNSDVCADNIRIWFGDKEAKKAQDGTHEPTTESGGKEEGEADDDEGPSWGNSLYNVRFPMDPVRPVQPDGQFRPPFSWKYTYWMDEAVDVPEFVVPWEAFRSIAESYNLEQRYRKPFLEIWEAEQGNHEMMALASRMGVTRYEGGEMVLSKEEMEAVGFYHAFCFVKV